MDSPYDHSNISNNVIGAPKDVPINLAMTPEARAKRRDEKFAAVLGLLADFEVFTTAQSTSLLLSCSIPNARRTLLSLEKAGYLKSDYHVLNSNPGKAAREARAAAKAAIAEEKAKAAAAGEKYKRKPSAELPEKRPSAQVALLFGITQNGLAYVDAPADAPLFEVGRQKNDYINHKLECQRVRILSEKIGCTVTSERKMKTRGSLKKIPDLLLKDFSENKFAIEVEMELKSRKRMEVVLDEHIKQAELNELYDTIIYLVPKKLVKGAIRLLASTPVSEPPFRDGLPAKRKYRLAVGSLEDFPNNNIVYVFTDEKFTITRPIDPSTLE